MVQLDLFEVVTDTPVPTLGYKDKSLVKDGLTHSKLCIETYWEIVRKELEQGLL